MREGQEESAVLPGKKGESPNYQGFSGECSKEKAPAALQTRSFKDRKGRLSWWSDSSQRCNRADIRWRCNGAGSYLAPVPRDSIFNSDRSGSASYEGHNCSHRALLVLQMARVSQGETLHSAWDFARQTLRWKAQATRYRGESHLATAPTLGAVTLLRTPCMGLGKHSGGATEGDAGSEAERNEAEVSWAWSRVQDLTALASAKTIQPHEAAAGILIFHLAEGKPKRRELK